MFTDNDEEFENDSDFSDDEFDHMALIIAFPKRQRIFRPRIDHFTAWIDDEFFDRFRLSKNTVRFIVDLIGDKIKSPTTW